MARSDLPTIDRWQKNISLSRIDDVDCGPNHPKSAGAAKP